MGKKNGFTKRVEYLYLKSMVIQRWMEKSSHIRQYGAAPAPPSQSAGQPQHAKATQGTRPRTAAAKSTASPKPAVGANSPVGSGKQTGKQTGKQIPRPQTSTTSTPTSIKETKALHGKMKNLMASASDILAEISANDEWKSVRHFCGPTDVARKKIEGWRAKSHFWRQWTVCRDVGTLKMDMSDAALANELKVAPQLDGLLDELKDALSDLNDHKEIEARRNAAGGRR